MSGRTLVLGWGGQEVHDALALLGDCGPSVELLEGGAMAPHLLPHLDLHQRVLLLGSVAMSGEPGNVYRFRGADLERLHPLSGLHEAAVELALHERQPHEFMAIIAEPGPGAASSLASAARRQLALWSGARKAVAAHAGY